MYLNIDNLSIEVTRKCNMSCEHCLRGASQRKTISDQHIYKILQLIDNVNTLSITGGEPTLAMDSLEQIQHCVRYGNCEVSNFYMVTNGKAINVEEVARWAYNMLNGCSDNEMSSIGFSFDQFHINNLNCKQVEKQKRNFDNLQEKLQYEYGIYETGYGTDFVLEHSDDSWGYHNLLKEGRAKDFGVKDNYIRRFEISQNEEYDSFDVSDISLNLSCSGYIVAGCDWSYHSIDNNKDIRVAHIDDINCTDDLIEAIKTYNKCNKVEKLPLCLTR